MLLKIKEILQIFNNEITYVHYKSNEHIEEGLNGETDLDFLILKENQSRVAEILTENHFICARKTDMEMDGNIEHWFGCDNESGRLVHFHIYYLIRTGKSLVKECTLDWDKAAFETAEEMICDGFPVRVVSPEFELLLLTVRLFYKAYFWKKIGKRKQIEKSLSSGLKLEYKYLKEKIRIDKMKYLMGELFPNISFDEKSVSDINWLYQNITKELVKRENSSSFCDLKNSIVSFDRKAKRRIKKALVKRKPTIATEAGKRLPKQGVVIAFLGSDGSGKSTITKDIAKWLGWKFDVRKMYLGSGDGYFSLYKSLKKMILKEVKKQKKGNQTIHKMKKKGIVAWMENRHHVRVIKTNFQKLVSSGKIAEAGGVVITDRYPQNQVEGICDGPKIDQSSSLWKKEKAYFDKLDQVQPDLVFKLAAPLEVVIKRRPEDNPEYLKYKQDVIEQLNFPQSVVHHIDSSMQYEDELRLVKSIVWDYLFDENQKGKE